MPKLILSLSLLLLLSAAGPRSTFAGDTEADLYRRYVDQAIPLSFQMAQADAEWRESLLYFKRLSDAQQTLAEASDTATEISRLIPLVPALKECPRNADGTFDNLAAFRFLAVDHQLQTARSVLEHDLSALKTEADEFSGACERGFERYMVNQLDLTFTQVSVDDYDGVYVEGGSDAWQSVVTVAESLVQIFTNDSEQHQIEEQQARLEEEKVKSADYQQDAREACHSLMKTFAPWMKDYQPLTENLTSALDKMSESSISASIRSMKGCLDQSAAVVAEDAEQSVLQSIQADFMRQKAGDLRKDLSIHANLRMFQGIAKLRTLACGDAGAVIRQLRSDVSLSSLYSLSGNEAVVPQARQALAARAEKCNGAYL